jgi:lysophospholipase L1-like esterase
MEGPMIAWRQVGIALAAVGVLTSAGVMGMSAQVPSPSGAPSPGVDHVTILVIGDSIPYNLDSDCPGCTSFADSFGDAVAARTGLAVDVDNRSRHDGAKTGDVERQLTTGELDSALSRADVVIVSVGFNDQPPYDLPSRPCSTTALDTDEQAFAAIMATTTTCVDEVTAEVRTTAAAVLAHVRSVAPDAAIGVLTSYNSWTGWPALDAVGPETAGAVTDLIVYALEEWRSALCDEAAVVSAVCIDLLEPFNGPDGRTPAGDLLATDYTHPSQLGNDRIRDVLLESGLYPLPEASPATL